jgi:hypothetical protein
MITYDSIGNWLPISKGPIVLRPILSNSAKFLSGSAILYGGSLPFTINIVLQRTIQHRFKYTCLV